MRTQWPLMALSGRFADMFGEQFLLVALMALAFYVGKEVGEGNRDLKGGNHHD